MFRVVRTFTHEAARRQALQMEKFEVLVVLNAASLSLENGAARLRLPQAPR